MMFKNGKYRFKETGTVYYAQLKSDGVWVWKGPTIKSNCFCGVKNLDYFLSQFEKI